MELTIAALSRHGQITEPAQDFVADRVISMKNNYCIMKAALAILIVLLGFNTAKAQQGDSARVLHYTLQLQWLGHEVNTPYPKGPAGMITRFRNDSLAIPDSAMQKYAYFHRVYDPSGIALWYQDKLHNGWYIPWTEMVTSGGFYIQVYRNYIIAGLSYENPGPPSIHYIQAITGSQFYAICRLLIHDSLKSTVKMDSVFSNGKYRTSFRLNEKEMGLYTRGDFYSYMDTATTDSIPFDADKQFITGLLGFIDAVNSHLEEKVPIPVEGTNAREKGVLANGYLDR
jgi:hypothetical protein